ncbi:MAG: hypothetical protein UU47_C0003G0052 [candidate division TM6 bacterium GW2011_GWE2_41_16]|nr:MAG: hypothetical protein UU47_C0003G0052 [candidate division TM6 bacterium GW2011_GWE2_41_16]
MQIKCLSICFFGIIVHALCADACIMRLFKPTIIPVAATPIAVPFSFRKTFFSKKFIPAYILGTGAFALAVYFYVTHSTQPSSPSKVEQEEAFELQEVPPMDASNNTTVELSNESGAPVYHKRTKSGVHITGTGEVQRQAQKIDTVEGNKK